LLVIFVNYIMMHGTTNIKFKNQKASVYAPSTKRHFPVIIKQNTFRITKRNTNTIKPLNAELNPICYLLALLAQPFSPR